MDDRAEKDFHPPDPAAAATWCDFAATIALSERPYGHGSTAVAGAGGRFRNASIDLDLVERWLYCHD